MKLPYYIRREIKNVKLESEKEIVSVQSLKISQASTYVLTCLH